MLRSVLEVAMLCLVLASIAFSLVALSAARRFARRPGRAGTSARPPVSLLVPLRGVGARAQEIFGAFCLQDYPEYQVVFGVREADDPSVPLVEALIASLPDRDVTLVVGDASIGPNPKVANLHNMLARAKHETLVMADADILVSRDFLSRVVPPLSEPRVGLVTCLYRSRGARGLAARLEAVGIAGEFAPRVLVARFSAGVPVALGATMATTKTVLAQVGGFPALSGYLADDFELGSRVARAGYEVHLSSHVVETVVAPQGIGAMLRHQLRWNRTMRVCRPRGYLGLLTTHGITLALLALLLEHATAAGVVLPLSAALLQTLVAWVVGVRILGDGTLRRDFWLLPVRDLLGFGVWWASLLGRTIQWGGVVYRVAGDGRLAPRVSP